MNSVSMGYYDQKAFSFDMQTSSGDTVSLDFNNETSLSASKEGNTTEFSFSRMSEFSFSYQGNGLDDQDMEEIQKAMAEFSKQVAEFFTPDEEGKQNKGINQLEQQMSQILPLPENEDQKDFMKSSLVDLFDSLFDQIVSKREEAQTPAIPVSEPEESVPAAGENEADPAEAAESEEETSPLDQIKEKTFIDMREVLERLLKNFDQQGQIPMYA